MTAAAERAEEAASRLDPVQAVSRFFQEDPARILTVAAGLRAPDRTLESTVLGMSMGRTIPAGSRVRIELAPRPRLRPDEVVAFVAGPHVVVHRVVRLARRGTRGYLLTRGDAALVVDPPIDETRVLGRVITVHHQQAWVAPGPPPPVSASIRVVRGLVLQTTVALLRLHPRAAAAFVAALHRAARPFRAGARTPPPDSGPAPSGAA
jgi:hypothetical protein